MQKQQERLQKILSAQGIASRRKAEQMILDGRVHVNGIQAVPGQSAVSGLDDITVDGVSVSASGKRVYIMLNKPCGYITTLSDESGRKTVMDLLTDIDERIYPVGRLDTDSEGLLLFTNDGEFANSVMHPSNNVKKTYEVKVNGDVRTAVNLLRQPVETDDKTVHAEKVELLKIDDNGGILTITIIEGRNRQIRKMCTACGLKVRSLKRISIGTLKLGGLKSGQWRHLTGEEVKSLG